MNKNSLKIVEDFIIRTYLQSVIVSKQSGFYLKDMKCPGKVNHYV